MNHRTNLDEVVKIIRGSSSPPVARAALMAREWPVAEIAPYIKLVEAIETEVEGAETEVAEAEVAEVAASDDGGSDGEDES